jgi:hypothetical protein
VAIKKGVILDMAHAHWESHRRSVYQAVLLDRWVRGEQYEMSEDLDPESKFFGRPYAPRAETSDEYTDLSGRSTTPWAGLIVTSLAQTAYVEGVRRPEANSNMKVWDDWQANRWDSRQTAVHRTAIGLSTAYGIVLPGEDPLTGATRAKMLARSPKRMSAYYDDDDDEWCQMALEAERDVDMLGIHKGYYVRLYDEDAVHYLYAKGQGAERKDWIYISYDEHPLKVPPVARLANRLDLDGRATGEIEPILPLLRRIDQDTFDRLIVQRFGAWKVRYIAGMAKPTDEQMARLQALRLRVEDLLISGDHETKFGTLDATDLKGFMDANDADLRMLAAITQTPPHHLLGVSSNLQAEALAAAEAGLQRKSADFKMNAGEFHEQMFRMVAMVNGDKDEASVTDMQVRWRDTESRSLNQAAQALGLLASQLKVPVEMLWERIPGWSDQDGERARKLIEDGSIEALLAELALDLEQQAQPPAQEPGSGDSD